MNALERAMLTMVFYQHNSGLEFEQPEDIAFHLLTDLRHWCAELGVDFDTVNAQAAQQYADDLNKGA